MLWSLLVLFSNHCKIYLVVLQSTLVVYYTFIYTYYKVYISFNSQQHVMLVLREYFFLIQLDTKKKISALPRFADNINVSQTITGT